MYNCTHCNKTFENIKSLNGHLNSISENSLRVKEEKKKQLEIIRKQKEEEYSKNPAVCHSCNIHLTFEKYSDKLIESRKSKYKNKEYHFFCSRSCSATYSNTVSPKRYADDVYCKGNCGKNLGKYWVNTRRYCDDCLLLVNNSKSIVKKNISDRTLSEYLSNYKFRQAANRYSTLRKNAKKILDKTNIEKCCKNCKYDKHVEVCHKKGITEFSMDSLISEINSLENLIYLCPNCHWEFDNNLLVIS